MELSLFTQDNPVGEEIVKTLRSKKYSDFKVAVAYLRNSCVSRIYNELSDFANSGGKTSVIAGIDQDNTSYQALVNLKTFAKDELFIHHDTNFDITFHPKVYLFGNRQIEKVIVGSSNLTAAGFFLNYEANIGITLDNSAISQDFQKQITTYWNSLLNDENTKPCDSTLLGILLKSGLLIDEQKKRNFEEIIGKITIDLPFHSKKKVKSLPAPVAVATSLSMPPLDAIFAMTLSGFDVSSRSQDPIILIPIAALKSEPAFWNFPMLYTDSGAGYPQLYVIANIYIDGRIIKDQHIRIYYYDRKKEFRLQCEPIKRNGNQGDIITIKKNPFNTLEYEIQLIRKGSPKYAPTEALLKNKASNQKYFNYF